MLTTHAHASWRAFSATLIPTAPPTAGFDTAWQRMQPAVQRAGDQRAGVQRVGVQYAGAITPVSTDTRVTPRPPANSQTLHTGSIRDDVARYNEERVSRQIVRPPVDSGRQQGASPYRN
ncbi:hypothetical protein [Paraburkholderia solisilvae]|nr:hypothetical protein [Paraburkholderia solisilvae]